MTENSDRTEGNDRSYIVIGLAAAAISGCIAGIVVVKVLLVLGVLR